jgi:hypothetical protein
MTETIDFHALWTGVELPDSGSDASEIERDVFPGLWTADEQYEQPARSC